MGLKKRLKKKLTKKMDFAKSALGKETSKEEKYKDQRDAALAQIPTPEDPNVTLEREMKDYGEIEGRMLKSSEDDARRAGTYADTDAFRTSLRGEASARARGLKSESLARINALRKQLGMPEAPAGSI